MEEKLQEITDRARVLRRRFGGGSLTFWSSVVQKDWEGVAYLLPQQRGMHGVSTISKEARSWLKEHAQKDGYTLET